MTTINPMVGNGGMVTPPAITARIIQADAQRATLARVLRKRQADRDDAHLQAWLDAETIAQRESVKGDVARHALKRVAQIVDRCQRGALSPAVALVQLESYAPALDVKVYDLAADAIGECDGELDVKPSRLARGKAARADADTRRARKRAAAQHTDVAHRGWAQGVESDLALRVKLADPTPARHEYVTYEGPAREGQAWPIRVRRDNVARPLKAVMAVSSDGTVHVDALALFLSQAHEARQEQIRVRAMLGQDVTYVGARGHAFEAYTGGVLKGTTKSSVKRVDTAFGTLATPMAPRDTRDRLRVPAFSSQSYLVREAAARREAAAARRAGSVDLDALERQHAYQRNGWVGDTSGSTSATPGGVRYGYVTPRDMAELQRDELARIARACARLAA